jgi:hypothetical protein
MHLLGGVDVGYIVCCGLMIFGEIGVGGGRGGV